MKTIKLPNALTIAIGQYYVERARSRPHQISQSWDGKKTTITYSKPAYWDKEKSLERISEVLPRGCGYQAVAGSFWISKAGNKKTHYYINEELWPFAEIRKNNAPSSATPEVQT
jgi:hypothetical protein